jgi:hypothetical protein
MKLTLRIVTTALLLGGSTIFAQVPGMMTMQQASVPQGTDLGANTTVNAAGIALGNRVKLRGFVDFRYDNTDVEYVDHDKRFRTGVDLDLLIDFSPVTSEIHLNAASGSGVSLEQAFIRYSFNRDFNLSMGRQLTVMGMESDESTGLYQVSHGYAADVAIEDGIQPGPAALSSFVGLGQLSTVASAATASLQTSTLAQDVTTRNALNAATTAGIQISAPQLPQFRRNYVDGVRANFNNARFGLTVGLHNGLWGDDNLNDSNIGIDIAAAMMIVPGLEWQMGYAYESNDNWDDSVAGYNSWVNAHNSAITATNLGTGLMSMPTADHISQFNTFLTYQTGGLTLGIEYDMWDIYIVDMWNVMLMGNYQFNNLFGLTLRYSHEDFEIDAFSMDGDTDRFTISPSFSITDNFTILLEYSHISLDSTALGGSYDADEVYAETLFSF